MPPRLMSRRHSLNKDPGRIEIKRSKKPTKRDMRGMHWAPSSSRTGPYDEDSRIALTKVPGGHIRSAELETARGQRFWSVYIAKPESENVKEIRVGATSGQILAVQTERSGRKASEKPLRDSLATKVFNLWITTSHSILYDINCMILLLLTRYML